jgi:flagellar assembly factor FliW
MKITTSRFGELEINEQEIIEFPQGILGFESTKSYVVLGFEEQAPFKWLQAVEDSALAFVIAEPFLFFPGYEFDLADEDAKLLEAAKLEDLCIYVIFVIRDKTTEASANLMAPIVVNAAKGKAKQVVLNTEKYTTKHLLFS